MKIYLKFCKSIFYIWWIWQKSNVNLIYITFLYIIALIIAHIVLTGKPYKSLRFLFIIIWPYDGSNQKIKNCTHNDSYKKILCLIIIKAQTVLNLTYKYGQIKINMFKIYLIFLSKIRQTQNFIPLIPTPFQPHRLES